MNWLQFLKYCTLFCHMKLNIFKEYSTLIFPCRNAAIPTLHTKNLLKYIFVLVARRQRKDARHRRQRTTFSQDQTLSLEIEYQRNEYISRPR